MSEEMDYFTMLFQLKAYTNYADDYLLRLKPKEIEELWVERVLNGKISER